MTVPRRLPTVPPLYRGLVGRTLAAAAALAVVAVVVPVAGSGGPAPLGRVQRVAAADAPTGVVVTAPTDGRKLAVRWNAVSGASGYTVYVYTGTNQGSGTAVASGTTSYTATGLTNGTAYSVVVSATKTNLLFPEEFKADAVTGTPADAPPGTPANLAATPGDRQAALTWTAPDDVDIARYEVLDAGGAVLRQVAAGTTSATVTNLVNGTEVTFRVRTVDTAGNVSPASAPVATTPRDTVAPGVPRNWTANANDGAANFAWAAPADTDIKDYLLLDGSGNLVKTVSGSSTSTYVGGLVNGRSYSFSLKTRDTSGNLSAATAVKVVVPRDSDAPAAPRAVTATVEDRRTTLSWTAPADTDLARYEVLDASGAVVATVNAPTRTAVVNGLTNGTAYSYSVRAVDTSSNTGPASSSVTVTPRDTQAPAAPTGLAATAADRGATLTWTAPADTDVARYQVLDGNGVVVTSVDAPTRTVVLSGLTNGAQHTFSVRAVDTSGNSGAVSAAVSVTPRDTGAPAAPTGLVATATDRGATLTWTAPADTDLARYEVLDANGAVVATVNAPTRTAVLTGLTNGAAQSFSVRAVDTSANTGPASSPVTVTPRDTQAPAAPTALSAVAADGGATLSWTAPADTDLARYEVLDASGAVVATVNAPTRTVAVSGLTNGTAYGYSVRAVDTSSNTGPASSSVTVTPRDTQAPAAPTGLTATAADRGATLSWTAPTDADVARYEVLDANGAVVTSVAASTRSVVLSGLTNGTTYSYSVRAVDTSSNTGPASSSVSVTPRDTQAPAAPTGLTATAADRSVTLTWTAPADTDLARYEVLDANGVVVTAVSAPTRTAVLSGLTNGTTYSYSVRAVDTSSNTGPASSPVSVTPRDTQAPAAPTALSAVATDGGATVSWTAPADTDLARYEVLDVNGAVVATVNAPTRTVVLSGLTNGVAQTFSVRAVDTSANTGPASASVTVTPRDTQAPAAPTALVATAADRSVTLTWTAPADTDLARYEVLDGSGAVVATVTAPTRTVVLTGLTNGTASSYSVRAVDTSSNTGPASSAVSVTPRDTQAPSAPTDLAAAPSDRGATLTWTAPADTDLARYEVLDASGVVVATVNAPTRTVVLTGLANGAAQTFSVRAVDTSANTGPASASVTVTPRDTRAPAAPTALTATATDRGATLTWTAPADTDLARYEVLDANGVVVTSVTAPTRTVVLTGLTNGSPYRYSVRAADTSGNTGPTSSPVTVTPRDTQAPAAPANLTATAADHGATLSWTAPADTDVVRYEVLDGGGTVVATVTAPTTTVVLSQLTNGAPQTFSVRAVDSSANLGAASSTVSVTPRDAQAPGAPTTLTATPGDRAATLSWTAPGDVDLASYRVLAADGTVLATVPAGTTTATLTGLPNGVPVTVTVTATDTSGNTSAAGGPVTFTPRDAVAPGAPGAVTATAQDGAATLSWTAPSDADVARYEVRTTAGTVLGSFPAPATGGRVTGLTNGTAYDLVVVAVDTSQNASTASVTVTTTPVARTGGGTTVTGSGGTGFGVSRDGRFVVVSTAERLETSDTNSLAELHLVDEQTGTARRLAPQPGSATVADPVQSAAAAVSADGRYVALATTQKLVAGDTNTLPDVYRFDTTSGAWQLVSVPAGGTTSASVAGTVLQTGSSVYATSPGVVLSADGQQVFFYSARADLVAGDTNGAVDLFAKDMATGTVTRVSVTANGASIPKVVTGPALAVTPDGRFAVFPAAASNGPMTLLRKDLVTGELVTVSAVVRAGQSTEFGVFRDTGDVAVSDDGRYVVLSTAQKVLTATPSASYSTGLAYRKDVQTGELLALGTGQSGSWEHRVAIDPSGRFGFYSTVSADVAADRNLHTDVYRRDLSTGALLLVTSTADGSATPTAVNGSVDPKEYGFVVALSADRVVVSSLQAMDPRDTNRLVDTHLKDLATGAVGNVVTP